MNTLDHLSKNTQIVADTGLFNLIKKYEPRDSTTNPSLILAAVKNPEYTSFIKEAIEFAKKSESQEENILEKTMERLHYLFGNEILKIVPGRVSIEVDARLSFSIEGQVKKALKIVEMFEKEGISKERILIKLSSTWEGIQAAKILESTHGIHCNLTLMFSMAQAIASAEARVTLVSPFVGRILDWFKRANPQAKYADNDPGVAFVAEVFYYYKRHGYKTQVMGASFRNVEQILSLCGCDLLTISPSLMDSLMAMKTVPEVKLINDIGVAETTSRHPKAEYDLTESEFRWMLNEDQMATEKLSEGIRLFAKDARTLEDMIGQAMSN